MCLARSLGMCLFHVSASGAIIAADAANSRRLSQQNPYKIYVLLVELGRTSRHFIVHLEKIVVPSKRLFPGIFSGFPGEEIRNLWGVGIHGWANLQAGSD